MILIDETLENKSDCLNIIGRAVCAHVGAQAHRQLVLKSTAVLVRVLRLKSAER